MDSKFKVISQFIEKLEKTNSINDEEQALLLIGGNGTAVKTNGGCTNAYCSNAPCSNTSCDNGDTCSNGSGCVNAGR